MLSIIHFLALSSQMAMYVHAFEAGSIALHTHASRAIKGTKAYFSVKYLSNTAKALSCRHGLHTTVQSGTAEEKKPLGVCNGPCIQCTGTSSPIFFLQVKGGPCSQHPHQTSTKLCALATQQLLPKSLMSIFLLVETCMVVDGI